MSIEKSSFKELKQWLELNKITEVECIFPDMAGSTKGKILPVNRFIESVKDQSLKLADSVFGQTVSGKWIDESQIIDYVEKHKPYHSSAAFRYEVAKDFLIEDFTDHEDDISGLIGLPLKKLKIILSTYDL